MAFWHDRYFSHLPHFARDWAWYKEKNLAITRWPIVPTVDQARETAKFHGMKQSYPSPGVERWDHADGSWMKFQYGQRAPTLGYRFLDGQEFHLGRLPYNNRLG